MADGDKPMSDKTFPHLRGDGESMVGFPDGNVDVYRNRNDFDYNRWEADVGLHMCSVPWDGMENVIDFTETSREEYFASLQTHTVEMESLFHLPIDADRVKVPVPYATAQTYNYIYIDLPVPTDPEHPLDYLEPDSYLERYYYFIDSMKQLSPSTTELWLRCDYFTTYGHNIRLNNAILARGHYPLTRVDTDTYLADPYHNMRWLGAPEPDAEAGEVGVIRDDGFVPVGQGRRALCIATNWASIAFDDVMAVYPVGRSHTDITKNVDVPERIPHIPSTAATYANDSSLDVAKNYENNTGDYHWNPFTTTANQSTAPWIRNDMKVSGFAWNQGYGDYSGVEDIDSLSNRSVSKQNMNMVNVVAFRPDESTILGKKCGSAGKGDYYEVLEYIYNYLPHFVTSIQAIFFIDEELLSFSEDADDDKGVMTPDSWQVGYGDYPLAKSRTSTLVFENVKGVMKHVISDLTLEKSMFSYPTQLSRFAKLYTSPYSYLDLADGNGKTYRFKIQDVTSDTAVTANADVSYPVMSVRAYVRNLRSDGKTNAYENYNIKGELTGTGDENTLRAGDRTPNFDFEIQTSGMWMREYVDYSLSNWFINKQNRTNSVIDYLNAEGSANASKASNLTTANKAYTTSRYDMRQTLHNAYWSADITRKTAKHNKDTNYGQFTSGSSYYYDGNAVKAATVASKYNSVAGVAAFQGTVQPYAQTKMNTVTLNQSTKYQKLITQYQNAQSWIQTSTANQATSYFNQQNVDVMMLSAGTQAAAQGLSSLSSIVGGANAFSGVGTIAGMGSTIRLAGYNSVKNTNASYASINTETSNAMYTNRINRNTYAANFGGTMAEDKVIDPTPSGSMPDMSDTWSTSNSTRNSRSVDGMQPTLTTKNNNWIKKVRNQTYKNAQATARLQRHNAKWIKDYTFKWNYGQASKDAPDPSWHAYQNNGDGGSIAKTSYQTSISNAKATMWAARQNAGNAYNTQDRENKRILENKPAIAQSKYDQAKFMPTISYGKWEGDATLLDWKMQGVHTQINTQNDSDLWRVGTEFARFGYTLGQFLRFPAGADLQVMKHFTYWKCTDIQFDYRGETSASRIPTSALDYITELFVSGVTVWTDPDDIGNIDIFDN